MRPPGSPKNESESSIPFSTRNQESSVCCRYILNMRIFRLSRVFAFASSLHSIPKDFGIHSTPAAIPCHVQRAKRCAFIQCQSLMGVLQVSYLCMLPRFMGPVTPPNIATPWTELVEMFCSILELFCLHLSKHIYEATIGFVAKSIPRLKCECQVPAYHTC